MGSLGWGGGGGCEVLECFRRDTIMSICALDYSYSICVIKVYVIS